MEVPFDQANYLALESGLGASSADCDGTYPALTTKRATVILPWCALPEATHPCRNQMTSGSGWTAVNRKIGLTYWRSVVVVGLAASRADGDNIGPNSMFVVFHKVFHST
jgi:hypothetical protein